MTRAPTSVSPESAQLQETITFEEASTTRVEDRSAVAKVGAMLLAESEPVGDCELRDKG
jgi:hypothetical protein